MKSINLESTIKDCSFCDLCNLQVNKEHGRMFGFGDNKKRIMIVGINPSIRRNTNTKYAMFTETVNGTSEGYLKKCINELGYTYEDLYFTNLLKCSTDNNDKPSIDNTNICVNTYLMQEFALNMPKKIFCLGSFVYEYLLEQRRFTDYANLYKVYHHSYIKRSPDKFEEWKTQFLEGLSE